MGRKEPSDIDPHHFREIDPWKSEDLVARHRNLPHLEVPGATYFVTFRCCSKTALPAKAHDLVMEAIRACDRISIELDAAVVMPDHAHAIFKLINTCTLGQVLQRIKGRSARQINKVLGTGGSVWMDESFDHIIRDEAEPAGENRIHHAKSGQAGACGAARGVSVAVSERRHRLKPVPLQNKKIEYTQAEAYAASESGFFGGTGFSLCF
ncbi:MAG: transposase [Candidatus Binataceae bacterium]